MIILMVMPLRFCEELFNPALKSQRKVKHMIINIWIMMVIMSVAIFLGIKYGAIGLAFAWAVGFPIAFLWVVKRNSLLFNIPLSKVARLFVAPCIAGALMLVAVILAKQVLIEVSVVNLLAQILLGGVVFLLALFTMDKAAILEVKVLITKKN